MCGTRTLARALSTLKQILNLCHPERGRAPPLHPLTAVILSEASPAFGDAQSKDLYSRPFASFAFTSFPFVLLRVLGGYFFSVTISEKSAIVENSFSSPCNSASRFARRRSSSTITITLSKNLSTAGRIVAISPKAPV